MAEKDCDIDLDGFDSTSSDEEEKTTGNQVTSLAARSSVHNRSRSESNQSGILQDGVNQLNAYYGTPSGGSRDRKRSGSRSREHTPSNSYDELRYDFKSKHFSADKFVEKKVNDMTVDELVGYSNELNHGVKALDSEMQMMVYDNYNKFISATDTIRKMKDQVENMEQEMSKLLLNMNSIATSCSEIETRLQPNRSEVEKLVSVRGLLKKLEFLFELPNRLRKNIELGNYHQAVRYYQMATKILSSYHHIESFNRISTESTQIVNDLQHKLKKQMVGKHISAKEQLDVARLLLQLGQQPELLWYDIFKTRKDALLSVIITLKSSSKVDAYYTATNDDAEKEESKQEVVEEQFDDNNPFSEKAENTDTASGDGKDDENENNENGDGDNQSIDESQDVDFSVIEHFGVHFVSLLIEFVEQYENVFIKPFERESSDKDLLAKSQAALTNFTRSIYFEYFNVVKQCLQRESTVKRLTAELKRFYDGLQKPSDLVPAAKLKDRGTEIIEWSIRTAMEREFVSTQRTQWKWLVDYVVTEYDASRIEVHCEQYNAKNNEYHIKKMVQRIKVLGVECLNHLVPVTVSSDLITILDLNFEDQLWSYTAGIFKVFYDVVPVELCPSSEATIRGDSEEEEESRLFLDSIYHRLSMEVEPIKLLVLSKVMVGVSNHGVQEVVKHFKRNFLNSGHKSANLGIYKQEVLLFQKYCQECSSGLRLLYAQRVAEGLNAKFVDPLERNKSVYGDGEKRKEIIMEIQKEIDGVVLDLKKVYKISADRMGMHLVQNKQQQDMMGGDEREYDKLFNEGCLIFDKVEDDADSVLYAVYKIVFKHWSEVLRLGVVRKGRLNLIEGNVDYFRRNIPNIVDKKHFKKLQTLLDEIQQSAKERCVSVLPTADDIVDID